MGEEVEAFERELAVWWGVPHAVGVASGLDALEIALRGAGLPNGARVLTTPLTAFATTLAIVRAGGEPIWCDVDDSGGLDLWKAEQALSADPSIRAMVPVHLYGNALDPMGLERLCSQHDVLVVEDCAQSAGAERGGRATGAAGIAAGTSLYPTKNLGALGDGGVLLTEDPELAERARELPTTAAAAAIDTLPSDSTAASTSCTRQSCAPPCYLRLNRFLARRREIASAYDDALADGPLRPLGPAGGRSARHLYPVEVVNGEPAAIATRFEERGVSVGRHYPILCPDQPAVEGVGVVTGSLPVARRLAERELSLPIHPYLDDDEVAAVVEACREVCA